jgi:hypothetical protein
MPTQHTISALPYDPNFRQSRVVKCLQCDRRDECALSEPAPPLRGPPQPAVQAYVQPGIDWKRVLTGYFQPGYIKRESPAKPTKLTKLRFCQIGQVLSVLWPVRIGCREPPDSPSILPSADHLLDRIPRFPANPARVDQHRHGHPGSFSRIQSGPAVQVNIRQTEPIAKLAAAELLRQSGA